MQSSSRFIKALRREPVDRTPVWIMRQAGRYLPEYRAIREKMGSFLAMCQNPQVAAEITLQPLQRFELDAAIIFSDILIIPHAMGLGLHFKENEGPHFENPVRDLRAINQLPIPDPNEHCQFVMDAIRLVVKDLPNTPLIGFCGSPWTVATYMVEGKSSKTFSLIKKMMINEPAWLLNLLTKLTLASCQYLQAQIEAGAKAVMIFDTWGGVLSLPDYRQFSLQFMKKIVSYLKQNQSTRDTPVILFTKQANGALKDLAACGSDAVGLDWTCDMATARQEIGDRVALQGNLDPAILYGKEEVIRAQVKMLLAAYGKKSGHIFNLGHGIYPDTPPENVKTLVEAVKEISPFYHSNAQR